MALGLSISVMALGVVLRWVVGGSVAGVSLATVGLVLMIAGVIAGLIALAIADGRPSARDTGRPRSVHSDTRT